MTTDKDDEALEPKRGKPAPTSEQKDRSRQARRRQIFAVSVTLALLGGAAVAINLIAPRGPSTPTAFVVDVFGERFVIRVTDPETTRLAEENLIGGNRKFPSGALEYGDGGFNAPWSWRLRPETVRLVEQAIELCDGRPSDVEQNLAYWVGTVGTFCPWSGRIVQALGP